MALDPFSIEWRRRPDEPLRLERPALLISADEAPPREVRSLAAGARAAGRPLAVLAPSFDAALSTELHALGVAVFEACDLPGQPATRLLEDAAVYAGAACLSRALGFGLEVEPGQDHSPLVVPEPIQARMEDLGSLAALEYAPGRLTLLGPEATAPNVGYRVAQLRGSLAVSDAEAAGLESRLARLGAGVVQVGRAPAPVFALRDGSLHIPTGYRSPYLITDPERSAAELVHPRVLVMSRPLRALADMAAVLRPAARDNRPLLVAAPRVSDEALSVLVVNKLRGIVQAVAIDVPDEAWLSALGEFARAAPAALPFDPGATRGAVDSVTCDARSTVLSRGTG